MKRDRFEVKIKKFLQRWGKFQILISHIVKELKPALSAINHTVP